MAARRLHRVCSVANCGRLHRAKGLCGTHYFELKKYGSLRERTNAAKPERICSVPDCGRPHNAHGWCQRHYKRWKKFGYPLAGRTEKGAPQRYFEDVVLKYDGDDCLIWPFARGEDGYGTMTPDAGSKLVHRQVCEQRHGQRPTDEHEAAHICGNGRAGCVTPSHIVWKTKIENMADKIVHGTHSRGERCCNAKLTEGEVRKIRELRGKMIQRDIAAMFGVAVTTISGIHARQTWAWLPDEPISPK